MESSSEDGLTVSYDEESGTITFDWDNETHPEYSFLNLLTPEESSKMLMDRIKELVTEDEEPTIQAG